MGTAGRESSEPGAARFSRLGDGRKTGLRESPHVTGLGLRLLQDTWEEGFQREDRSAKSQRNWENPQRGGH